MRHWARLLLSGILAASFTSAAFSMSLRDAVQQAVSTHPGVGAARAASRASIWDFKTARARLAPTLDVNADAGAQYVNQPANLSPNENAKWDFRRQAAAEIVQFLFDGWDRANDIYRNAALVDAASSRTLSSSLFHARICASASAGWPFAA